MRKIFIVLCMFLMLGVNTLADSNVNTDEIGSITIKLVDPENKAAINKASYTFYKVADVTNNTYTYTGGFSNCTVSLSDLSSSTTAASLASYATANGITGTVVNANGQGKVFYSGATTGLYLVVNTSIKEGYNTTASFLVSVPLKENGQYYYNVNATPKMSLTKTTEPVPPEIPVTGVLWWPVSVFAGLGIILVSAGIIKKFKYEKTI